MKIIAHRGCRKHAPENSIPAFKKVLELDSDGVEFDVLSTFDGVPVVIHDDNLFKLSGTDINVHNSGFARVREIDIGSTFNPYFAGEKIPTLVDVLTIFKGSEKFINIELKKQPRQSKHFIERVLDEIKGSGISLDLIQISSFDRKILYNIGRLAPEIHRSLLLRPKAFFFLDLLFFANVLSVTGVNVHGSMLRKLVVKYARLRKWEIFAWTLNNPNDIRAALKLQVDGIITDEPMLAKEILKGV